MSSKKSNNLKNILRVSLSCLAFAFLFLSVFFIVVERSFLPDAWYPYQVDSLSKVLKIRPIIVESTENSPIYSRSWFFPNPSVSKLHFDARVKMTKQRDIWGASDPAFQLNWVTSPSESHTRVFTPHGADPFLYRSVSTKSPIASHTFRVSIQMRSRVKLPLSGCRGIWLQENGGTYSFGCFPVALSPSWHTFRFEWTAPEEALSKSIRVVLNDFDGLEFDVRDLVLEQEVSGVWESLLPLEPTGAVMLLDWSQRDKNLTPPNVSLIPDNNWHNYTLTPTLTETTKLTASLWLLPEMSVEIKNVNWELAGKGNSQPQGLLVEPFRSVLWFGHPNYAGHSLATITLIGVFLATNSWLSVVVSLLGLVGVYFTESRTAWFALGIGLPWLFGLILSKKQRYWFFGTLIILAILGLSTVGSDFLGRLASIDQSGTTRQSVWRTALSFIKVHPWNGSSNSAFTEFYAQVHPGTLEKINHAHNFWLQMGVRFGVFGLLTSLGLTLILVRFVWFRGNWKALAVLIPILGMNMIDYSLDFAAVSIPLLLFLFWLQVSSKESNSSL
jgi:O-Antigen ligase